MTKHLRTVEQVVDFLGGNEAVLKLTGRSAYSSAVSNWKYRDERFPTITFKALTAALQARGATAPDKLWGF